MRPRIFSTSLMLRTRRADDDDSDYRILDGYDAYYERLAAGLDIRLNCAVQRD